MRLLDLVTIALGGAVGVPSAIPPDGLPRRKEIIAELEEKKAESEKRVEYASERLERVVKQICRHEEAGQASS